jgi:small subunit ribosomal protein S2
VSTSEFASNVAVKDLLDAGLHFGHQTKRWNPKMKRYIFGARNGIYIIDLDKSLFLLKEAQKFLYDTVARGRSVLFVGTKKQAQEPVKAAAERCKQPYIVNRWLGGTLTNLTTIRKSVARYNELERMETDGSFEKAPKKEVARMRHELEKLRFNLSGVRNMDRVPGAMFVVDTNREAIAVAEAKRLKIPVVAVVDTNSDPDPIDHPIPGNDDAIRAIKLITDVISEAVEKAEQEYAKVAAEENKRKAAEEAAVQAKAKAEHAARAATLAAHAAESTKDKRPRRPKADEADASETPASPA